MEGSSQALISVCLLRALSLQETGLHERTSSKDKLSGTRVNDLTHSIPRNKASFLVVVLMLPAECGPLSANSTVDVLENTAKLKPASKQTSFQWRERALSLPTALFWCSNRPKYDGYSKKHQFSEALVIDFSWMMTASIKLLTRMMDGCLILNKLGRRRVRMCQRKWWQHCNVNVNCWNVSILIGGSPATSQLCTS